MQQVTCDKCKVEFSIEIVKKYLDYKNAKVEKKYFVCPVCNKEYLIAYATEATKDKINKKQKLRQEMRKTESPTEHFVMMAKHMKLQKELLAEQKEIEKYFKVKN